MWWERGRVKEWIWEFANMLRGSALISVAVIVHLVQGAIRDKAFYENLPFHGLKKPPPQVLLAGLDNMDYADAELKNGPAKGPTQSNGNQSEKEKKTTGGSRRV